MVIPFSLSLSLQIHGVHFGADAVSASDLSSLSVIQDLEYLGKVLAGSIVGGAVIKYGSIVFPEMTRPNIILALVMIFTPVILATLLLIKQSRANG